MNLFVSFLLGLLFSRYLQEWKVKISKLLTLVVIPLVIIGNITVNGFPTLIISFYTFLTLTLFYFFVLGFTKDRTKTLLYVYLNFGMLGLPLGHFFFEELADQYLIPLFVGSSIFGNLLGAISFGVRSSPLSGTGIKFILRSPIIWALVIGVCLRMFPIDFSRIPLFIWIVGASKKILGSLGLFVLGIYIAEVKAKHGNFKIDITMSLSRIGLATLILLILSLTPLKITREQSQLIFFVSLLPPAVNITIFESLFLKTGLSSIRILQSTLISIIQLALFGIYLKFIS